MIALFLLMQIVHVIAQNNKLGSWNVATLFNRFNNKWGMYAELQARSQRLTTDFFYHEAKAGLQYYLPHNYYVMIGFGNYETYTYPHSFQKPVTANEYRSWEQLTIKSTISRINIEHRYRIEQRWINGVYSNRFRYRINPVVPVNHSSLKPKTVFVSAFDEIFFTNTPPYFIRNRIFAGAGFQFTKKFMLQTGFIRQFDYRISDNGSGKNYIQTSAFFILNKHSATTVVNPSPLD